MLDRAVELLGDEWVTRHFRGVYGHVVVDEAQNLTPSQYTLIASLIGPPPDPVIHVALVGDQRQSIVGFAGADPTLMNRFHRDYGGERVDLRTNYRSATSIINAGRSVSKALHADATSGRLASSRRRGRSSLRFSRMRVRRLTSSLNGLRVFSGRGCPATPSHPESPRRCSPRT